MSETIPFYPWSEGDQLYASALNAAIANSVALGGDNKNFRTPYDFGAKGVVAGVPQDDTAALNTAFAQIGAEGGGRIYIPDTFLALGALTVPANVDIYGNFTPTSQQYNALYNYFQVGGSKLILGASGITLGRGNILRNVMIISNSLPRTNPVTVADAQALINGMTTSGTGVTLGGDNCLLDSVQVLGFNYGIYGSTRNNVDRLTLRNIHGDNINGIHLDGGEDMVRIIGGHFWNYLTIYVPGPEAILRPGVGIYIGHTGCNFQVSQFMCFGYHVSYQVDAAAASFDECWGDSVGDANGASFLITGACSGTPIITSCVAVAQQFGVHHSPTNATPVIIANCILAPNGPGGTTPSTGARIAVYADGSGPVQCVNSNFSTADIGIWLGPNTGRSIVTNNTFDASQYWGYVWSVDPAVLPLLTKHSNRVINATAGFSEQNPTGPVRVDDTMPQALTIAGGLNNTVVGGIAPATGYFTDVWVSPNHNLFLTTSGQGTDQNLWSLASIGGGSLSLCCVNDAANAFTEWLHISRTGHAPQTITLTAQAVTANAPTITLNGGVELPTLPGAYNYPNDVQAANGGIAVGQFYRNGSVVMVRVS
jgi:hypothetical protein